MVKKRKSKSVLIDEVATAAINYIIVAVNSHDFGAINIPYLTMVLQSGRYEEATRHLDAARKSLS